MTDILYALALPLALVVIAGGFYWLGLRAGRPKPRKYIGMFSPRFTDFPAREFSRTDRIIKSRKPL